MNVCLDQQGDHARAAVADLRERILQLRWSLACKLGVAELALTIQRHFACLALALHGQDFITGVRRSRKAEHHHRHRGTRRLYGVATLIEHGAHPSKFMSRQDVVAKLEAPALHQDRCHRAASLLQR